MSVNKLLAVMFIFACGQIVCAMGDGLFIGGSQDEFIMWINDMMGFRVVSDNIATTIVTPLTLFTQGFTKIFLWNYSCFDGMFVFVRFFLCLISGALTFGLLAQVFGRSA